MHCRKNRSLRNAVRLLAVGGVALALAGGCKQNATEERPPARAVPAATTKAGKPPAKAPVLEVPRDPATVLASVDGEKLTLGQADKQIDRVVAANEGQVDPARLAQFKPRMRRQITEQFVLRTLLRNEAERQKITVGDADITNAIAEIKTKLPEGLTLEAAMAKEGVQPDEFRTNLVAELKVKKLVESQFGTNTAPSAAEVAAFYESQKERFTTAESVHARHVLVKVEDSDDAKVRAEKKAKAEKLQQALAAGGDFEKIARESSDCPSKAKGGDLGTFSRGQMVKPFEDAAFGQATNVIGPVVETPFGYHVIQVVEHSGAQTQTLDKVQTVISDHLKQRNEMKLFETYVAGLKAKAKIAYDKEVEPVAAPPMGMGPGGMMPQEQE